MEKVLIPSEYRGWWRILETSQWVNKYLDENGTALMSITGEDDCLRMFSLLAESIFAPTKAGLSFTWQGSWEWDPVSGTGRVKLGKDGLLKGFIKIHAGDESTFLAKRTEEPLEPIPPPLDYRDKWGRRRRY